jgi:hypothetical protein
MSHALPAMCEFFATGPALHNLSKIQKGCRSSRVPIRLPDAEGRVFPGLSRLLSKTIRLKMAVHLRSICSILNI